MRGTRAFALIAILALVGAPAAEAKRHHRAATRTRRCHNDKQCHGGTCNGSGQCCSTLGGEVACGASCCDTLFGESCCGSGCANLNTDDSNCGGCGVVCSGGSSCQNGACTCPLGETKCGDACVSTLSDNANCGSCGKACTGLFKNCLDGACVCPAGTTDCGDCVDTSNDPNNCGGCGVLCGNGADCVNGVCQTPCPLCQVNENGTCVPRPCGACEICSETTGQCEPTCFPGQTCCGDTCVNTETDPSNCGGCGTACPASHGCTNGSCDVCPDQLIQFVTCPATDPTGSVVAICCRPETPQCCAGGVASYGACCTTDETCCDSYCCQPGTHCCANPQHTYPCIPDGMACPS